MTENAAQLPEAENELSVQKPEPVVPKKPRIRPEMVISIFSLALSLTAAATNLFQARLQREQQQTSVWPYLETNANISSKGFSFTVANKGVGPAIIVNELYRYKGQDYGNLVDLMKNLPGFEKLDYSVYNTEPALNRVLSPQERLPVFGISEIQMAELAINQFDQVEIYLEYKSIYGKSWLCRGQRTEELK